MPETPLLEARSLTKSFPWRKLWGPSRRLVAVDGVDLEVSGGECLALVGESGSGKTTLGQCLLRLLEPDAGELRFAGEDLLRMPPASLRRFRRQFQMVFQDSGNAFNPRHRVRDILAEPLEIHRLGRPDRRVEELVSLLAQVGLGESALRRYAHQLSGGQRQRLGIARALAVRPRLVILDEPVAALDVSVQAHILQLLDRLRTDLNLALVFISHDLAVVRQIAERVMVLYLGQVVESGPRDEIFHRPQHPYTAAILQAVPVPFPGHRTSRRPEAGEIPSPLDPPTGCRFHPRCPIARQHCTREAPKIRVLESGSAVACHYPGQVTLPDHHDVAANFCGTIS